MRNLILADKKDDGILEQDRLQDIQYGVTPYVHTDMVAEDGLIQERYWGQLASQGWPKALKAISGSPFWEFDAGQKVFYYVGPLRFGLVEQKDEK